MTRDKIQDQVKRIISEVYEDHVPRNANGLCAHVASESIMKWWDCGFTYALPTYNLPTADCCENGVCKCDDGNA